MDKLTLLSGSTITQQGTIDAINKLVESGNNTNRDIGDINNYSGKSESLNGRYPVSRQRRCYPCMNRNCLARRL